MAINKKRDQQEKKKKKLASARDRATETGRSKAFKVPDGMSLLAFKSSESFKLDSIPYVAGPNNPNADEGFLSYDLIYFVHKNIGPQNATYCCPAENWGKPCCICRARAERVRQGYGYKDELVKALAPQKRNLMLFRNNKEPNKGIQLYEGAFHNGLGQLIYDTISLNNDPTLGWEEFHDPEDGLTLIVGVKDHTFPTGDGSGSASYPKPTTLNFTARKESVEDLVEKAPNLEELLIEVEDEDLEKLFNQTGQARDDDEDTDKEEKPAKKAGKKGKEPTADEYGIEVGMMVEHDEHGECEVVKISRDGTSLTLKDDEDDTVSGVGPEEVTILKEDEKPAPKAKAGKKPAKVEEDDDDKDDSELEPDDSDDDDSDDDDSELEPEETDSDDDDDDDDSPLEPDDDDDDDSELEPPPKKKAAAKKPEPKKKAAKKK